MYSLGLSATVWLGVLLPFAFCQNHCRVQDGKDGLPGNPGRDGIPGPKGEKGQPALQIEVTKASLSKLQGDMGPQGPQGDLGPKGYLGPQGPPGPSGPIGPKGSSRAVKGIDAGQKPAFSVRRNNVNYPSHGHPVTFDSHLSNINGEFNLVTGKFTCKVPGVYYFVFHSVAEGKLCLKIKSDSDTPVNLSFCDFNPKLFPSVVSGGTVLKLAQNNKVWIEPFMNPDKSDSNKMSKNPGQMSAVFNGFLLYPSMD